MYEKKEKNVVHSKLCKVLSNSSFPFTIKIQRKVSKCLQGDGFLSASTFMEAAELRWGKHAVKNESVWMSRICWKKGLKKCWQLIKSYQRCINHEVQVYTATSCELT